MKRRPVYEGTKRGLDVGLAACGLLLTSPLMAAAALLIKLESPGPVLFPHERVGRNFKHFRLWKFRSMVSGADKQGPAVTSPDDQRVTRLGRFLRASKIDELPQLWNVVIGDLSLVGPRPEAPCYVELYLDDYREILRIRPGITDEAVVLFRSDSSALVGADDPEQAYVSRVLPFKIGLYHAYLEDRSLRKDLSILFRTMLRIVRP